MEDFEEALRNIDIFCRILVKKIAEDEDCTQNIVVEPIENLLRRKYIIEESQESKTSPGYLIPLPQAEEPLIDVFEDEDYVKIFLVPLQTPRSDDSHRRGWPRNMHTRVSKAKSTREVFTS